MIFDVYRVHDRASFIYYPWIIKDCEFVGFSHGRVWWQLHSCRPHPCPRSTPAHNFTAERPGTNDKAPHPSSLRCLRSDVYVCGVLFVRDFSLTVLSLQACATQEQVHMSLRWLMMGGWVDRSCTHQFRHVFFRNSLCAGKALDLKFRNENTWDSYVRLLKTCRLLEVEMKMRTWRELRVRWYYEGCALFLPSAHNMDPCESLGLMSHVSWFSTAVHFLSVESIYWLPYSHTLTKHCFIFMQISTQFSYKHIIRWQFTLCLSERQILEVYSLCQYYSIGLCQESQSTSCLHDEPYLLFRRVKSKYSR